MKQTTESEKKLLSIIRQLLFLILSLVAILLLLVVIYIFGFPDFSSKENSSANKKMTIVPLEKKPETNFWLPPDTSSLEKNRMREIILYGRELIANTSKYLGPKGSVSHFTNGMNCQNCHLEAGTKIFGNNYSAVASTYPKFRARSGSIESIEKRVNDCVERSLNGKALNTESHEMKAIIAYINWLGKNVAKGETPNGAGLVNLNYLNRAADAEKGQKIFSQQCTKCHGANGEGKLATQTIFFQYPPLWGNQSYTIGAGLFRLSRFAGYVKANMPLSATFDKPILSDEEAWDVAAFVNNQFHPTKDISTDWPDIAKKPIDNPFGPYADKFSEKQHKFGPFTEMVSSKKKN